MRKPPSKCGRRRDQPRPSLRTWNANGRTCKTTCARCLARPRGKREVIARIQCSNSATEGVRFMFFAFRVPPCLLALSLVLVYSALAQSHSSASVPSAPRSSPGSPQSSDEETIRALTEKYASAIASGDLDTMRQLWDPQSPNLAARLRLYQGLFSNSRMEFVSQKASGSEITGEKAVSRLTTDERQVDKKTGAAVTDRDLFHGACRSLEWIKTGAGWKIERESLLQDELATRLEAVISEDERREILEKEKVLVTDVLVRSLIQRGDRSRIRGDSDTALRCLRLAQAVAEKV